MSRPSPITTSPIPLHPTSILNIPSSSPWSKQIPIYDITPSIQQLPPYEGLTPCLVNDVQNIVSQSQSRPHAPPPSYTGEDVSSPTSGVPVFTTSRPHWYSHSTMVVVDAAGKQVAQYKAPISATGTTTLTFPEGSAHSSHQIQVKPVGLGKRTERFVKDSVEFLWEPMGSKAEGGNGDENVSNPDLVRLKGKQRRMRLYRMGPGEKGRVKRVVGEFAGGRSLGDGGTLALDTGGEGMDELVAVLSCLAVWGRRTLGDRDLPADPQTRTKQRLRSVLIKDFPPL